MTSATKPEKDIYNNQRGTQNLRDIGLYKMTGSVYHYLLLLFALIRVVRTDGSYGPPPATDYDSILHLPHGPYLDMFPLSGHNFTEKVLNSKDPWIVVFHEGVMSRNWRAMAESLRGVVWVGTIDRADEKKLT